MRGRRTLGALRAAAALLVLAALGATGCTRQAADADDRPDGPSVPTCEPGFSTPAGFERTESHRDPYEDHVGIRLGFVAQDGREIHYLAGIPGEFGEGLPVVGSVEAADGVTGTLQGRDDTWVLTWRGPGPCGVRAVIGYPFTRRAFLDTLERAGVIPAG